MAAARVGRVAVARVAVARVAVAGVEVEKDAGGAAVVAGKRGAAGWVDSGEVMEASVGMGAVVGVGLGGPER